jgi:hypothetical protein
MVIRCHYHQHPEDYGGHEIMPPRLPDELSVRGYEAVTFSSADPLPQEPMGHPQAVPV